jgi:hypothetical protein
VKSSAGSWATWLGLLVAGGAVAADDAALRAVDACVARLDARVDVGLERVRRRCPDLLPALERAEWRGLLPASFGKRREDLSAEGLRALAGLVRQSRAASAPLAVAAVAPDPATLAPVLADLGEQGQEGASRWQRFKRWLREKFERNPTDEPGWIDRWASRARTSEGIADILTYVGYGLLGLLVLAVIWAELRAAGLFGGARRAAARANPAAEWRRRLMLEDVLAAPLADRPGMLLRLLGEALTRAHRLPAADGLTAAGIVRRADVEPEERAELERVASAADAVRYGRAQPREPELEATVTAARGLLARFARRAAGRR